jgi:hypothetical protein
MKKYRVTLMAEERAQLREVLARGKSLPLRRQGRMFAH